VAGLLADARSGAGGKKETLDSAVAAAYLLLNGDGDVDTAHRLLEGALNNSLDFDALPPSTLDNALSTLLGVCVLAGRPELWETFTSQLQRLRVVPTTLHLSAHTFASPARNGAEALDELRTVIGGLERETDIRQVVAIGKAAFYVDELEGCRPALWKVVTQGLEHGSVTSAINAWTLLAFDAFIGGRWKDACGYARQGLTLCESQGYQLLAWPGRYCLALVAAAQGDDAVSAERRDAALGPAPWGAGSDGIRPPYRVAVGTRAQRLPQRLPARQCGQSPRSPGPCAVPRVVVDHGPGWRRLFTPGATRRQLHTPPRCEPWTSAHSPAGRHWYWPDAR
jgi:hypothetical protein